MAVLDNSNLTDIINERNEYIFSLKSSLETDEETFIAVEKIKSCVKYLQTFNIYELNEGILKWLMPLVKNCLSKALSDNSDVSDTSDDVFFSIIFKQNLKVAVEIMQVVATIINFITEQKEAKVVNITCLPINVSEIIIAAFEHCKNSTDLYKSTFNVELLELFNITQEVHSIFLNLMESLVILRHAVDSTEEIVVIKQVLDSVCQLSEILFNLNFKSCTTNWKGYINILSKYLLYVKELVDIKIPIKLVTSQIVEIMDSISKMIQSDLNRGRPIIKLTRFLIRVVLKVVDMFWSELRNICEEVLAFCLTIYSYSCEYFLSLGSTSIANSVNIEIRPTIEPFLRRLIVEEDLLGCIMDFKLQFEKNPTGALYFIDIMLKMICERGKITKLQLDKITSLIFECLRAGFVECYWESYTKSIFDKLVVHLSGVVLIHPKYYTNIEPILLENVLDDNTWCAFLALDVWTMLLSICPSQFCLETLINLIHLEKKLDFGFNTYRPEHVHLKSLIKRVYEILPNHEKSEVVKNFPLRSCHSPWKIIGLDNIPEREVPAFYKITMNNIENMGTEYFTVNNLKVLAETFELLSTLNFAEINFDITALLDAVTCLWDVNHIALLNNNVFRFFITKLCKLTRALIKEFNYNQMLTVLNQMKVLSIHDSYKLAICDILETLPDKNFNDFGQNGFRIFQLTSQIIINLMTYSSNAVKQNVLELIQSFRTNGKENVINEIIHTSKTDIKCEIIDYFNKEQKQNQFDKEYYEALKNNKYEHKCVQWRNVVLDRNDSKRLKQTEDSPTYSLGKSSQLGMEKPRQDRSLTRPLFPRSKSTPDNSSHSQNEDPDSISEALATLKGDVKCLTNILKTEKLSAKNCSDLKMIANQLLSLM